VGKLTRENQGYRDRLQRAQSWLARAQNISGSENAQHDFEGQFIFYWVALNALYARAKGDRRSDEQESKWLVDLLCDLDQCDRLRLAVSSVKQSADKLLRDKYLSRLYWAEGTTTRARKILSSEEREAQAAWQTDYTKRYLDILFRRLHVLRNQIFHGCSTDRGVSNKGSLKPAVAVLGALVPSLIKVMQDSVESEKRWPRVEFPRDRSPQNPDYIFIGR